MNRRLLHTLAFTLILVLAVVASRQRFDAWNLKNQVEAHDQRLRDLRDGWNGLDELHHRITKTQTEQIRLQRELDKLQKPVGSPGKGSQ